MKPLKLFPLLYDRPVVRVLFIAVIRLLGLGLIAYFAYQAQQEFEALQDNGFRWLAAGGVVLLLIVPALPPLEKRFPIQFNVADKRRLMLGGAIWLVGLLFLLNAAADFRVLQINEMASASTWTQFGIGVALWMLGGFIITCWQADDVPSLPMLLPVSIFVLAIFLRLYQLNEQPRGIWFDEGINALAARQILENPDYRPTFVPNITAPHLFLYASGLKVFGETDINGLRIWSVFFGAGTVILAFHVGRVLHGAWFGLLFALILAVMRWSLNFSRIGMTGIEMGFFTLLALYFIIRLTRYGQMRDALMVGFSIGAGLWFYSAFRVLAIPLVMYGLLAWRRWPSWKAVVLAGVIGLTTLAVIFPLAIYADTNSETFLGRTRSVTILNEKARDPGRSFEEAFRDNLKKHVRMFHIMGDSNGRHNIPYEPMLDPYTGLLFGLGLVLGLRFILKPETVFFLLLLGAGLSGGVLTFEFEAPQGLRSIGVLPAVGYFAALAAWGIGLTAFETIIAVITLAFRPVLSLHWPKGQRYHVASVLLAGAGIILTFVLTQANFRTYFQDQQTDFSSFYEFSISETLMGEYAANQPENTRFYVAPLLAYEPVGEFLSPDTTRWQRLVLPDIFPLRIAPENPVVIFLHFTDAAQFKFAQQLYPTATFITVRPSDYGIEPPDHFPILFYIISLQPQDIAGVQGLVQTEQGAEGYLYTPYYGTYRFWFTTGTTVTVNGQTLEERGDEVTLPSGNVTFQIEPLGDVEWTSPDDDRRRVIPDWQFYHEPVNNHGLLATFYANATWEGLPANVKMTPDINWQIHILPLDRPYSVRWTGSLVIDEPGDYLLSLDAADYAELSINGEQVLKTDAPRMEVFAPYTFEAGTYPIEVKFQDMTSHTYIYLRWRTPQGTDFVPIPREHFRPE